MADCYRRMGDTQARQIYERVVRDYGDQKEAVATARARLGSGSPGEGQVTRVLWRKSDVEYFSPVSADGRYFTFCDVNSGALALHDFQTQLDRDLIPDPSGKRDQWGDEAFFSVISRDSKMVAYSWSAEKGFELRIANLNGNPNPRRIYGGPSVDWLQPYDWSPDGKWVVIREEEGAHAAGRFSLVSVADGSPRVLKSPAKEPEGQMLFSSDSKYLAYSLPENGGSRLYVLAVDGSGETPITEGLGENRFMGWLPDGRILFAGDRSGSMSLRAQTLRNGKPQGDAQLINTDIGEFDSLGVSSSGALYLEDSPRPAWHVQIASMDPGSGKLLTASHDIDTVVRGFTGQPKWSPDGNYLSYYRGTVQGPVFLVVRSPEPGGVVRELPVPLQPITQYFWSRDGSAFEVAGTDSAGKRGVWRIDAATGQLSMIAPLKEGETGKWSPDGKTLYLRRSLGTGKGIAITERDVASGSEKELTRVAALSEMILSPDGKYLSGAGSDQSTRSHNLLVIPTTGGPPRVAMSQPVRDKTGKWPPEEAGFIFAGWAPDSRTFLVRSPGANDDQGGPIWRVSVEGAAPVKLDLELPNLPPSGSISLHPDGKRIAYAARSGASGASQVSVVENFLR